MRLVVDASVFIQIGISGDSLGPLAGHELISPPIMRSEFTSALSEIAFRGQIPPDEARKAMALIDSVAVEIAAPDGHYLRAWEIARQLGWAKSYDAEYVALAQVLDLPLVTIDARLQRSSASQLVRMPTLEDVRVL